PITFCGNEGALGLIRWIEKTEMVFTVSKCIEANKVVFAATTFQDQALTWWNSQRHGNARAMTKDRNQNTNDDGQNVKCNRMDWLILHDDVIVCGKKEVHVPLKKRTLVVKVVEKEPAERRLEDVPVICKFPDVFPEDLPGLPQPREVEFKIEMVPGAALVARAPYRLAPSEMKELAEKLQELSDKGFI
nr:putative reverse transcriptase domain-containing protein [Tanacetum cinerariifolium]